VSLFELCGESMIQNAAVGASDGGEYEGSI
jgi:hypothetical protein